MKRFIDQIFVRDSELAYTIIAALEKDGLYTTEVYTDECNPKRPGTGMDIKIFKEEKLSMTPVGFSGEEATDDTN